MKQLRALLTTSNRPVWNNKRWYKCLLAIKTWTNLSELLCTEDIEATTFRDRIVQQAYDCVASTENHRLLQMAFKAEVGSKLWCGLKFLARPIIDCRMLWYIASNIRSSAKPRFSRYLQGRRQVSASSSRSIPLRPELDLTLLHRLTPK